MPNVSTRSDNLVSQWRAGASADNPAGPLFSSQYAEFELTSEVRAITDHSCSGCTASRTSFCC